MTSVSTETENIRLSLNKLSLVGITSFASLAVMTVAVSMALAAQDQTVQSRSHQHGQAQMTIASDMAGLNISLQVPAVSIIGFEHAPQTEAQKTALNRAETILTKSGSTLFSMNPEAGCILTDAAIKFEFGAEEADLSKPAETTKTQNLGATKHNIGYELSVVPEDQEDFMEHHADFLVNWTFACTDISKLENIYVNLFGTFSHIEALDVSYIGLERQDVFKLNPDQTAIDLLAQN